MIIYDYLCYEKGNSGCIADLLRQACVMCHFMFCDNLCTSGMYGSPERQVRKENPVLIVCYCNTQFGHKRAPLPHVLGYSSLLFCNGTHKQFRKIDLILIK